MLSQTPANEQAAAAAKAGSGNKLAVPIGGSTSELRVSSTSKAGGGGGRGRPSIMTAGASPTPNLLPNSSGGGHGSGVTSRPPNLKLTVGERSVVRRTDREFRRNSSQLHLLFGRSHLPPMLQAKFGSQDQNSEDGGSAPLITKLDKYSAEELKEYRLVFNVFDADRSGAIGLDEMENAIINLGMDPKQVDLQALIKEADRRNNNQIDFDEFCEVMKTMSEKTKSWNEVIRDCFTVFDRNETGVITRKDFEFILRELGHIDNSTLMDELFQEFDVDSDGVIDFDEFGFLVKAYLTDDDVF